MAAQDFQAPESISRLQKGALIVSVFGILGGGAIALRSPEHFFQAYLISFLFILGLTLGSLGVLMLQHLTGGAWGIMIRRPLEAATRTLPLTTVAFLPIAFFGMQYLYSGHGEDKGWLNSPSSGEGALSPFQQSYLTTHGYYTRAVIYFIVWFALVLIFNSWSRQQDINQGDRALRRRFKMLAGPGIILYVFAVTFAVIDWVMSISPHWASTIYGFLFVVGQVISTLALMISILVLLARTEPFLHILQKRHLHDLGKLLLAFVMLWAYFDFSQLLIIWAGNQPEEITFYRSRLYGSWGYVAVIVLVFHFFVPFFLLLSQDVKRNAKILPKIAIWLIFMRMVDLYWMTRPEFTSRAFPYPVDLVVPLGVVGLWLAYFAWNLKQQPLLPLGDPKLAEAITNHDH